MDKSDVEMEDAEKLPRDFPDGVHESETKTIGVQIEREKEKASDEAGDANGCQNGTKTVGVHVESEKEKASEEEAGDAKECENGTKTIAVHVESEKEKASDEAGDANECENGSDSSKKVGNEANDKPSVEIEMEDQVDPKAEVLDKSGNNAKDKSLVDIEMENQVDPKAKDSDKSGNEAEDKASVERQMEDQVNLKSEDSDTSGNGAKDKPSVESEMKDQVDPKAEDSDKSGNGAKDKPSVESEVKDQVDPKAKDSDKSGNEAKDKPSVESEMEDQVDPKAEDSDKPGKEAKDKPSVESEMEDQVDPKTEIGEPLNAVGLVGEIVNAESENEGGINTKTEADEQTGAKSAPEKQNNAKLEVFEQNATTDGVKEDTSVENGENPVKSITEETPGEDKEDEMLKELGSGDADSVDRVAMVEKTTENARGGNGPCENAQLPTDKSDDKALQSQNGPVDEVPCDEGKVMEIVTGINGETVVKDEPKEQVKELVVASPIADGNSTTVETSAKHKGDDSSYPNQYEAATPSSLVRYSPSEAGDHSEQRVMAAFTQVTPFLVGEGDDGTPEDQAAFMKEIETFYRGRAMDFKPPKFYGQPLNCLKLWRAVIRLGGYDRVTGSKLWRQVGESFHPPKTCTTVSWTFRIFYEKSLLEYERHKRQSGELQLPPVTLPEVSVVDTEGNGYQGSGPGRARRDAAARAMQGWHAQRLFGDGEAAEQAIKDKNLNNMPKREKSLKSIGSLKQKRANDMENSVKVARTEAPKQLAPSVHDAGPPADWVKINIRQTKDTFEVYALVPGLLREEVRVQSDPQGRVVITGDPQQLDNPWGITKFQKVVNLHARIDPLQTSAVVSLHGRLLVTVPIEQSTNI